jgi:hypothetical protein
MLEKMPSTIKRILSRKVQGKFSLTTSKKSENASNVEKRQV